jgi:outer membrane protein insertion porin family
VLVDVSRGPSATPNGYEITFIGNELSRITGQVGTEIGQNEGALTTELASPNLFGRGERISVNGSYSNVKSTEVNIRVSKPFFHTELGDLRPE